MGEFARSPLLDSLVTTASALCELNAFAQLGKRPRPVAFSEVAVETPFATGPCNLPSSATSQIQTIRTPPPDVQTYDRHSSRDRRVRRLESRCGALNPRIPHSSLLDSRSRRGPQKPLALSRPSRRPSLSTKYSVTESACLGMAFWPFVTANEPTEPRHPGPSRGAWNRP